MINKIIWLLKELDYLSKFLLLTVVIVFMSFLEALGIAIIFPMVTTLLDENFIILCLLIFMRPFIVWNS